MRRHGNALWSSRLKCGLNFCRRSTASPRKAFNCIGLFCLGASLSSVSQFFVIGSPHSCEIRNPIFFHVLLSFFLYGNGYQSSILFTRLPTFALMIFLHHFLFNFLIFINQGLELVRFIMISFSIPSLSLTFRIDL